MNKVYIIKCESYRMFYNDATEDYIKHTKYLEPTYFVFENEVSFCEKMSELTNIKDEEEFNIWWTEENISYKRIV